MGFMLAHQHEYTLSIGAGSTTPAMARALLAPLSVGASEHATEKHKTRYSVQHRLNHF